jgi:hypothetical protein
LGQANKMAHNEYEIQALAAEQEEIPFLLDYFNELNDQMDNTEVQKGIDIILKRRLR